MKQKDIIYTMSLPKSKSKINEYKKIYLIATGKQWKGCLCGNGFTRLYTTCVNYANTIIK
jgi:hypothetical protein